MPPCLNEEKNPGPTCTPREYIYNMSPKFCASASISGSIVIPKCPAMIPTKNTKVTPSETPNIRSFPRASPVALISDKIITA